MIIVTGGAGFIGANLVKALNDRSRDDILVVDDMTQGEKCVNLADCRLSDYLDKQDFIDRIAAGEKFGTVEAIFHQGACSDTMEQDGRYMLANNFTWSKRLFHYAGQHRIPLIYASSASVYGSGPVFTPEPAYEKPLNVYAYSKLIFDQYIRQHIVHLESQIVGLRYFNVYGPREQHKGRMASVAYHFYHQFKDTGNIRLFAGSDGYGPGEQRRDFLSVEDVVKVNLHFLEHPDVSGIFNVGTGNSQSFNEVAAAIVNSAFQNAGDTQKSLSELQDAGILHYIPFPDALRGKYQSYTQADITTLREAGYQERFLDVEAGVGRYYESLSQA